MDARICMPSSIASFWSAEIVSTTNFASLGKRLGVIIEINPFLPTPRANVEHDVYFRFYYCKLVANFFIYLFFLVVPQLPP